MSGALLPVRRPRVLRVELEAGDTATANWFAVVELADRLDPVGSLHRQGAAWISCTVCFATFQFVAIALEVATFSWLTEPSSPGLVTRVGALLLPIEPFSPQTHGCFEPSCAVNESATAPWWFLASWPTAWIPIPQQPRSWGRPGSGWRSDPSS